MQALYFKRRDAKFSQHLDRQRMKPKPNKHMITQARFSSGYTIPDEYSELSQNRNNYQTRDQSNGEDNTTIITGTIKLQDTTAH